MELYQKYNIAIDLLKESMDKVSDYDLANDIENFLIDVGALSEDGFFND